MVARVLAVQRVGDGLGSADLSLSAQEDPVDANSALARAAEVVEGVDAVVAALRGEGPRVGKAALLDEDVIRFVQRRLRR